MPKKLSEMLPVVLAPPSQLLLNSMRPIASTPVDDAERTEKREASELVAITNGR